MFWVGILPNKVSLALFHYGTDVGGALSVRLWLLLLYHDATTRNRVLVHIVLWWFKYEGPWRDEGGRRPLWFWIALYEDSHRRVVEGAVKVRMEEEDEREPQVRNEAKSTSLLYIFHFMTVYNADSFSSVQQAESSFINFILSNENPRSFFLFQELNSHLFSNKRTISRVYHVHDLLASSF